MSTPPLTFVAYIADSSIGGFRMQQLSRFVVLGVLLLAAPLVGVPAAAHEKVDDRGEHSPASSRVVATPGRVDIVTEGGAPVVSKDDYVEGSMVLDGRTYALEIRGRGNSTWQWAKKPYRLKLAQPAGLVGPAVRRDWVLLANFADRSALRTTTAFGVAAATRLAWTPASRFVDVSLNGQPLGLYLLTDHVEQARSRVKLPRDGFLLEIDRKYRASGDPGFRTDRGTPVAFKDPDEISGPERYRVKRAVEKLEDVLHSEDFADPETGYPAYVDVDSFVDWYLVEELFKNQDSDFRSSVYVTWTPAGKFAMGPVWDFDLSGGTNWNAQTGPQGWYTRLGNHWLSRMLLHPGFAARVEARWAELRPSVDAVVAELPASAQAIRTSAEADWQIWHAGGEQVRYSKHADTFEGEVAFLGHWLTQRAQWLSLPDLIVGRRPTVVRERSRVIDVPIRLLRTSASPVTTRLTAGGTATPGSDYTFPAGDIVLPPGVTMTTVPVTIHADAVAEPAETIELALVGPDGPVSVGTPSSLQVSIEPSDQRGDTQILGERGRYLGDDVYNRTGRNQSRTRETRPGGTRWFRIRLENDGPARTAFTIRGSEAGPAQVRYQRRGDDITTRVHEGRRVRLAPGERTHVTVAMTSLPGAGPGSVATARLRLVWHGDRHRVDVVEARVRVPRSAG